MGNKGWHKLYDKCYQLRNFIIFLEDFDLSAEEYIDLYFITDCNTKKQVSFLSLTLYHTIPTVNDPERDDFKKKNIVGKGENAGYLHFLLLPQCFLPFSKLVLIFHSNVFCRLQLLSFWTRPKFCRLVMN